MRTLPEVGTLGSMSIGTDRYAIKVTKHLSPKRIVVQRIVAEPDKENGYDYYSHQIYKYHPDQLEGAEMILSLRKSGRLRKVGESDMHGSYFFGFNGAITYSDPSF